MRDMSYAYIHVGAIVDGDFAFTRHFYLPFLWKPSSAPTPLNPQPLLFLQQKDSCYQFTEKGNNQHKQS